MTDLSRAAAIAAELEATQAWRAKGRTAVAIASALLSTLPIAGGPLQVVCEKIGGQLLDPKLEGKFVELCRLIDLLAPEIERIEDFDARISTVAAALKANEGALKQLQALLGALQPGVRDVFGVNTVASTQEFINISIKDMDVLVEAHRAGVNYLQNVKTSGGRVQFNSTDGGHQSVRDSKFVGRSGGSVHMDKLVLSGVVGTEDGGPEHPGIGLGPGGSIGFGPGGGLGFGPAKRK